MIMMWRLPLPKEYRAAQADAQGSVSQKVSRQASKRAWYKKVVRVHAQMVHKPREFWRAASRKQVA